MKLPAAFTILTHLLASRDVATHDSDPLDTTPTHPKPPASRFQQFKPNEEKCGIYPTEYCAGTEQNASLYHQYVCGDKRLGPTRLPQTLPLDSVFDIYDRFGGLCPGPFLTTFWNTTEKWWIYPSDLGYTLNDEGVPIKGNITLRAGTLIDRFGGEGGNFSAPAGAPYMQRSLPPSNLDFPEGEYPYFPYNYHLYRVMKPFVVIAGPIAPWFGQPGQGVQYELYQNLSLLVALSYLKRVNPTVLIPV
ncbi:hypothetical protein B0T16DRAFT_494842 [Cercophora newfieldiana]|uniref:TNT domain-containing protein n=1 Tax=Cercophora newfieldiana TaxID=92897 RepID=A0AA39Y2G1_9PEZI|nr:hypothetical protein B0T16DRAFT_494842 [Cercophora newfieldiana]